MRPREFPEWGYARHATDSDDARFITWIWWRWLCICSDNCFDEIRAACQRIMPERGACGDTVYSRGGRAIWVESRTFGDGLVGGSRSQAGSAVNCQRREPTESRPSRFLNGTWITQGYTLGAQASS